MCSDVVVVTSIGSQDPAQMRLTKNDDMIQALAADRPDQPFGKAVLPRRGWCGRLVPDARGAQSARDDAAIDPVAISDEVVRSLIPRKRLRTVLGRDEISVRCDTVGCSLALDINVELCRDWDTVQRIDGRFFLQRCVCLLCR